MTLKLLMPPILPSTGMLDLVTCERRHQGNTYVSVGARIASDCR